MDFNEIQELIKLVNKSNLTEFKLKDKDFEIQIRTKQHHKGGDVQYVQAPSVITSVPVQSPVSHAAPVQVAAPVSESEKPVATPSGGKKTIEIKSPIVGTFYRSSGPDKPVFVKVGDTISSGTVVCIIEAMKLFNEIESDTAGTIVKILVEDATPVEYDQVLFLVEV
ncbi:MAG: acetyl-CoA carboxylase biotin carboxyl carrier protein [Saprospiraceae bacterium]|nr:acetyl-CoA carboxylase biotin carboxyl carrier protein [Saprospiraceae bacterium]MBK7525342.1 acetyl-CoA carboxylase biotin carboxyl carrier protein [Saprospiraceae bacterium]MBK8819969.1 acetyl-CoA carboxylase biotin carboxyl carrier protein [Saprospiraceae bacterium]MBK9042721.1 acetyl-CoA carboxylase biotin carboxyl carrier protein [Saprospiraceae bacterium]